MLSWLKQHFSVKLIPALIGLGTVIIITLISVLFFRNSATSQGSSSLPSLSISNFANRTFPQNFEDYFVEQLCGSQTGKQIVNQFKIAAGSQEIDDVFILQDRLTKNISIPNESTEQKNVQAIKEYQYVYSANHIYLALIPTSSEIYKDDLPASPNVINQTEMIQNVYQDFYNGQTIDLTSNLIGRKKQYIYFRTDSLWTSQGAYTAYSNIMKALEKMPYAEEMFNIEHLSHDVYGSLAEATALYHLEPDTVDLYHYVKGDTINEVKKISRTSSIVSSELYNREGSTPEEIFVSDNCGIVEIKTNTANGESLLLYGDNFSYPVLQFLALHYEKIVFVNLDYLTKEQAHLVDPTAFQNQLFLYSLEQLVADNSISARLSYFFEE